MRRSLRTVIWLGALLGLLLLPGGCDSGDRLALGGETNDPYYRQADQLKRQGRWAEALSAYLKVIEKRPDAAPQAHLEAGLIYLQYPPKDPIYAIYHFKKFLELEPNSREADLVRQRVDAAMRDFARSLPAQPLESQAARLELMGRIDELQKENLQLKDELVRLGHGAVLPTNDDDRPAPPPAPAPAAARTVKRSPLFNPPAGFAPAATTEPPAVQPAAPAAAASRATPPAKPPAPGGRRHVVAAGDTLYKIAQRYYGNGAKWTVILEANRDVLQNQNAVRVGMELKIP